MAIALSTDLCSWFFFSSPSLYRRLGSYQENFFLSSYPERSLLILRRWWVAEATRRRQRWDIHLCLKLSLENLAPWCWMLFRKGVDRRLGPAGKVMTSRLNFFFWTHVLCLILFFFSSPNYFFLSIPWQHFWIENLVNVRNPNREF